MMPKKKSYVAARVSQPSAHAGIAGIAAAITPFLPPQYQAVAGIVGALFGAVALFKQSPADVQ